MITKFDQLDKNVPVLESKGLCKYFGGLKAVDNVDMKVMPGDIFGIIGPNGAGKTTFFNMCTGMYTPTKGRKGSKQTNLAYVSEPAAVQVHECS